MTSTSTAGLNPHDNNAHMIYVPVAVFAVLCPALVALRVWSRLRKNGKLGPDDHTIFASLVFALASSGVMIASCQYGFGRHSKLIAPDDKIKVLEYFFICQVTYKASINLTKISILLLYLRIFGKIRWFKWACWFLISCVISYAIASVVATIFQCSPVRLAFDKSLEGTCIDNAKFWYANAGFSIATDLVILFMPMWLVYKLQIPVAQKMALIVVFALGSFVVITSCLRITTIDIIATTTDQTYDISSTMWTVIEMNVAIVCACLPMIRPLIVKIFPKIMPKSSSNNKYGSAAAYGSKTFMTGHSQTGGKNEWMELGHGQEPGIHMSTMKRAGSSTGSEESILAADRPGEPHGNAPMAIQKTVQYTVEYSDK